MHRLSIPQISTGDMLRDAVARQTSLGRAAKERMDSGQLVSDDIVNGIVDERIARDDCRNGFILDGYPRNVQQAETLQKKLGESDRLFVFEIGAKSDKLLQRLVGRLMCPGCGEIYNTGTKAPANDNLCDICGKALVHRSDDREDLIKERFKGYAEETHPLVEYYSKLGVYRKIDGMRPIAEVTKEIIGTLETEEVCLKKTPLKS
jgi:adenylate kinase